MTGSERDQVLRRNRRFYLGEVLHHQTEGLRYLPVDFSERFKKFDTPDDLHFYLVKSLPSLVEQQLWDNLTDYLSETGGESWWLTMVNQDLIMGFSVLAQDIAGQLIKYSQVHAFLADLETVPENQASPVYREFTRQKAEFHSPHYQTYQWQAELELIDALYFKLSNKI